MKRSTFRAFKCRQGVHRLACYMRKFATRERRIDSWFTRCKDCRAEHVFHRRVEEPPRMVIL